MTRVVIDLPDALAEKAQREGLLTEQAVRQLFEEATRIVALKRLQGLWLATPDALQDQPALSPDALQEVIRKVRRARHLIKELGRHSGGAGTRRIHVFASRNTKPQRRPFFLNRAR